MGIKNIFKKRETKLGLYIVLRLLVLATMIRQMMLGNWHNVFMCLLTLILFLIPSILEKRLRVRLPNTLEAIILLFIFSAEILGEINNFYGTFKHWDTMLHTLNGFLAAAIGFSLIDILNRNDKFHISMSPLFVALVSFCFSMTIGVMWEFFEFTGDQLLNMDMQKDRIVQRISTVELEPDGKNIPVIVDNIQQTVIYSQANKEGPVETVIEGGYLDIGLIDTMKDLIVNFIGAIVFSIFGLLYIKNRDRYKFAGRFIPTLESEQPSEEPSE
ncbi:hypothetical protein I6N95_04685 [Vagococcus sp. BWB3-3]|uniref:Uncharacterized protein n=1 Tax=Vagococcus allomyrinae TaxID=2794353 RepID=A0A940STH9_9ENTE|nr:hypothetical protein [Vagococcus allomyrinae]MBP1040305.1 hypothetical protein [Vagococcus allomyrinae]